MAYNRFKRDACCPKLAAKIDNMLVSLMRIAPIFTGGFGRTASLQNARSASCTARLAPSRASQLLGAKRGVIPDHILRRYAHQTYQHVVVLCRQSWSGIQFPIYCDQRLFACSPAANLIFPACLGKCLVSNKSSLCESCEEFKHSKSIAARARLL